VPIELTETKTKSGHPIIRTNFITEVTVADAQKYFAKVSPGGPYESWGHLVVGNVTGVSSEVKKILSSKQSPKNPPPVALVLGSALARMAASLTMRITGNDNTDSFKNEEEGLEWLDGRMAEFLRRSSAD
jgi:hypothetical protein